MPSLVHCHAIRHGRGWSGKRDSNPRPPAWKAGALPLSYSRLPSRRAPMPRRFDHQQVVGRGGFEPPKAFASRFTVCPLWPLGYLPACSQIRNPLISLALAGGFEPPTHCLQGSCSTPELRQQSQNFTLGSRPPSSQGFSVTVLSSLRPAAALAQDLVSTGPPPPPRRSAIRAGPASGGSTRKSQLRATSGRSPSPSPPSTRQIGAGQVHLPRDLAARAVTAPTIQTPFLLQDLERTGPGSSPGPPGPARRRPPPTWPRRRSDPAAWCLGTTTPWTPGRLRGPEDRAQVPRVLHLVQRQEERPAPPASPGSPGGRRASQ